MSLYIRLYDQTLACVSNRIRHQPCPAMHFHRLANDLHIDIGFLADSLRLPRSTIYRKIRNNENLNTVQAERVICLQRLVGQVQVMEDKSRKSKRSDASRWFGEWIGQPLPALGGQRPAEYLGDGAGRELISQLLRQIHAGVFA